MNKAWIYIIDIIVGILIMFVAVTIYFGLGTESVTEIMYENITEDFLNVVKKKGVLYPEDYENYIERMETGGNIFDIEFEHRYKISEPEYRLRTLKEIIEEQKKRYTGSNVYHYREIVTERPNVDDPVNEGSLNADTNESILEKAEDIPADPNHEHDANCYFGHKHEGTPVFIHEHAHTYKCKEYISYIAIFSTCNTCKERYVGGAVDYYWDSNLNQSVYNFSLMDGTKKCPYCGSNSINNDSPVYFYQWSCGYNLETDVIGSTERVPKDVVFQYEKSYPPEREVTTKQTYISGCYKYHEKGYIPVRYTDYYGTPYYNTSDIWKLLNYGFDSFCTIPTTIELKYEWDDDLYVTLRFHPIKKENSSFIFTCSGGSNINIYDSFPSVDFNSFKNLCSNSNKMHDYLKSNAKRSFIFSSSGRVYVNAIYGSQMICDEPIHDKWYTTCGLEEDNTVDCGSIVVSLVPTHEKQTVYINDPVITTAKATYRDGSSRTVLCTTDFTATSPCKDQDVTLVYNYTIDGKSLSATCKIKVTVIPRTKTCSKGHRYNLNNDGSDPGCPYCRAWVENLKVINPPNSPIVITIGTTLQENGIVLLATYMDGHTE